MKVPSTILKLYPKLQLEVLQKALDRFQINTKEEQIAFLAQVSHECANFTRFTENLNYSAEALSRTFPSRFAINGKPNQKALDIARKPELIGNAIYNGRMGNTEPNDGYKYRGRGAIQITGKDNYKAIGKVLVNYGVIESVESLLENPDKLAQSPLNIESACAYWVYRNCKAYVYDFKALTKRINGGYNGLADRQARKEKIEKLYV